ncbi:MAG: ATP-binding protein [Coriobacteriales bacterium]|nr:ATP-binding protein [Coriobacteriales bacterium]
MIERTLSSFMLDNAQWFPAVSLTGPRQSGKSTLVQHVFPDYEYVNLEDQNTRNLALADPVGFIRERPSRLIVDEAQRVPELFSAIQVVSDESGSPGQYVLSGSQNFLLLKQIGQTLAGRVGLCKLLPLSFQECVNHGENITPDAFMLEGGYPRLHAVGIPPSVFFENYLQTYVERDVTGYIDARSIAAFRTLLVLCAQSCGSLLNVSRLSNDIGVARATVESWLSILESSYILFRLQPYHANVRKRLTKTPKLYFYDTGLLCHLLGIRTAEQLRDSIARGAVFENLIVEETLKRHVHAGRNPKLYFYRDDSKMEVDLVDATDGTVPELVEIKSSSTFKAEFARHLESVGNALGVPKERRFVVMRSDASHVINGIRHCSARDWLMR